MERLNQISTAWPVVAQAQSGAGEDARAAQGEVLRRYYSAVETFLEQECRDRDLAAELSQEFAIRFLRGDFRRASPEQGRFRDYLRTALRHLLADHHRREVSERRRREHWARQQIHAEQSDRFLGIWRQNLLQRAWLELEALERRTGRRYFSVLRTKANRPELRSKQLAELFSAQWGEPQTDANVRQLLHRARRKFARFLHAEVGRSIGSAERSAIDDELRDLGLQSYFQNHPAMDSDSADQQAEEP